MRLHTWQWWAELAIGLAAATCAVAAWEIGVDGWTDAIATLALGVAFWGLMDGYARIGRGS